MAGRGWIRYPNVTRSPKPTLQPYFGNGVNLGLSNGTYIHHKETKPSITNGQGLAQQPKVVSQLRR
jgi:hypothetical protein